MFGHENVTNKIKMNMMREGASNIHLKSEREKGFGTNLLGPQKM